MTFKQLFETAGLHLTNQAECDAFMSCFRNFLVKQKPTITTKKVDDSTFVLTIKAKSDVLATEFVQEKSVPLLSKPPYPLIDFMSLYDDVSIESLVERKIKELLPKELERVMVDAVRDAEINLGQ
ncbi:MAG: hypothetical protein ACPG5B_17475 [Chitinophagales bacterium]